MNYRDKVGASAVGKLIRTKMKVAINQFKDGNDLIAKAHKLETQFSYGSERYKQPWKLVNALSRAHGEWVKIYLELNVT